MEGNKGMPKAWFALDLDDTLFWRNGPPFNDTLAVLQLLQSEGYTVCLTSYNLLADQLLKQYELLPFFAALEFDRAFLKSEMINRLASRLRLNAADAILVDDLSSNIQDCIRAGIHAVKVPCKIGLTLMHTRSLLLMVNKPLAWLSLSGSDKLDTVEYIFRRYFVRYTFEPKSLNDLSQTLGRHASLIGTVEPFGQSYIVSLRDQSNGKSSSVARMMDYRFSDQMIFQQTLSTAVGLLRG